MAKTPAERGEFGRWLERVRTDRYKTQRDALRAMERLAGLKISDSEFAQWESGSRKPRLGNPKVARLYEFFGSQPAKEQEEEPPPTLAAALSELAAELRESRKERLALTERLAVLEPLVRRLSERELEGSPKLRVPRATKG